MDFPLGLYQHFKGGHYTVLMIASDSETKEPVVVYEGITGSIWVRPLVMFTEEVVWPDGVKRPRFVRVGD
jgi:hypothetical protein